MNTYVPTAEIKIASPNIPAIAQGSDEAIAAWCHEAWIRVNSHCRTNFTLEQQTTRVLPVTMYSELYLPAVISGDVSISRSQYGVSSTSVDVARDVEVRPGKYALRYNARRTPAPNLSTITLAITADWGYAESVSSLLVLLANDLKARYNLHRASTVAHIAADATNVVVTANATDLATAITLLNDVKAKLNLHVVNAVVHITSGSPITTANATDQATAVTLAKALKSAYNTHVGSTLYHIGLEAYATALSVDTPLLPEEIKLAFTKVVQRLAIRDNVEDLRYHNSGFTTESFSDGYSYSLNDASLRYIITPSEMALLSEHVNEGQVTF